MLFDDILPTSSTFTPQMSSFHNLPSVKALGKSVVQTVTRVWFGFVINYS